MKLMRRSASGEHEWAKVYRLENLYPKNAQPRLHGITGSGLPKVSAEHLPLELSINGSSVLVAHTLLPLNPPEGSKAYAI